MEGFGYEEHLSPFHYGSVRDGMVENPSLEHKLKKQYWKTKQTVLQKLKKTEDEFVVAGDADIDAKLEKAQHLQTSCQALLRALNNYVYHTKALSNHEQSLGEYLTAYSETEFTQAGDVMKKAGKVYETNSTIRVTTIPPLGRLQHECYTFFTTAIADLEESINRMEKARKGYRAALLWMKDVSEKLHNPDLKDQLFKFRKTQATVKESKEEFERMKQDVMEKIDMVSASRCNLLSRSLPYYQEEALAFLDRSAGNFHELLTSLQNQSQPQYKMRSIAEEIRDLSVEEIGYETSDSPELGKSADLVDSKRETSDEELLGGDESLIDIIDTPRATPLVQSSVPPITEGGIQTNDLKGSQSPTPDAEKGNGINRVTGEVSELLDLLSVSQPPASEEVPTHPGAAPKLQSVMDQWDEFSSFVSSSQPNPDNSGWEHELSSPQDQPSSELQKEIDDMLGVIPSETDALPDLSGLNSTKLPQKPLKVDQNISFDPLQQAASVKDSNPASTTKSGLDDLTLGNILPRNEASLLQAPLLSAPTQQPHTHSALLPGKIPTSTPPTAPSWSTDASPIPGSMAAQPCQQKPQASAKKSPNAWMNVFAHLDPLANERA